MATVAVEVVSAESNASLCVPYDPVQQTLLGSAVAHTEHDVTLEIPPYGDAVLQLVVDAGDGAIATRAFALKGPAPDAVEGLDLGLGAVGLPVDANDSVSAAASPRTGRRKSMRPFRPPGPAI